MLPRYPFSTSTKMAANRRASGRVKDAQQRRILDDETRRKRQKRQLDALERDNSHDDPHAQLDVYFAKTKLPAFDDSVEGAKKRKKIKSGDVFKQKAKRSFVALLEEVQQDKKAGLPCYPNATVGPSQFPPRNFCAVCGNISSYVCVTCGAKYCAVRCLAVHQDTSNSANRFPTRNCLGTRELLSEEDEIQPNGRVFKKLILGEYQWQSYEDVVLRINKIGSGLTALGLQPKDNVIIFAETKADWMLAAQACFKYSFPCVTIYATLGAEALVYGMNEAESEVLFTDAVLLPKVASFVDKLNSVKKIVYFGSASKSTLSSFPKEIQLHSLHQIEELGSKERHYNPKPVLPDEHDVAVIMYTSGSTGMPKGVMISHRNLLSAIAAACKRVPALDHNDVYIGYLPLAHVLEVLAESSLLSCGGSIGYSSALTLSDQSTKIKKGSRGDITVLKPTLMAAVPMILDRIRKNVLDKVGEGPRSMQLLFKFAYDYKLGFVRKGQDTPLLNRLIFGTIRKIFGGRIRCILAGGAPLNCETEEFMNVCFCCPVGQGYGLTETCGAGTICNPWDQSTSRCGPPVACAEVKLVNWEEGGYSTSDKPYPRGEVVIGGDHVALGYFKQPGKTKESFTEENGQRWFFTGDIGEFHDDGCLKIIDRKKDLVKLAAGEYVSLAKVEAIISQSPYVDLCCVYGDGERANPVVLIVPNVKHVKELAATLNADNEDWATVCQNEAVTNAVLKSLEFNVKEGKLEKFEMPKKVKLCSELWTPESELVTAAYKLKRKNIREHYQADINAMYSTL